MKIAGIPRGVVLNAVAAAVSVSLTAHARDAVTYLDYVESKGHADSTASFARLDDVVAKANWKIMVDFVANYTETFAILSSKNSTFGDPAARNICIYNISGSGWRLDTSGEKGSDGNGGQSNLGAVAGQRQTFVYDAGKLYLDGTMILDRSTDVASDTVDRSSALVIFGDKGSKNPSGYTNFEDGRIYRVKIWDETGALRHDLRPAMNASGVAGLYDSMKGNFYASALDTPFTAGSAAAPDGVEFVEYVETSSHATEGSKGQFFNTEYVPSYDCKIEMDVAPLSGPTSKTFTFFRSNTSTKDTTYLTLFNIKGTSDLTTSGLRLDMGLTNTKDSTYTGQTFPGVLPMQNVRRTYVYDKGVLSIDGEVIADNSSLLNTSYLATPPNQPLIMGGSYNNQNNPVTGTIQNLGAFRFYRVRIWDGSGTLQRDMRPARDAAGNAGLYDVVNRRFHYHGYRPLTAAGATTYGALAAVGGLDEKFPVGPELEYLRVNATQWFDTTYIPTGLAKIEMDMTPRNSTSATYCWFSTMSNTKAQNGHKLNVFYIGDTNRTVGLRLDVNAVEYASSVKPAFAVRTNLVYNAGVLKLGDTVVTNCSAAAAAMGSAGWRTFLLASGSGPKNPNVYNKALAMLYGARMWDRDGGTLVRDFVPRRTASGFVGLYDMANDKFYSSTNGVSAIAEVDNMPTAADIEAAGDVVDSVLLARAGARIAGGFAQKVEESVTSPFAGTTRTAYCAYFPQSFAVAADGEGTNVVTATTGFVSLGKPFSSAEGASWTAVLRVRREARDVDVEETVLSLGSDCAKDGVRIGFCGSEANRRLDVRVGDEVWPELSGFAAPAGDWLDIAVAVDAANSTVRVYYCREGGSVIWAGKTFDASAGSDSIVNLSARQTWEAKVGGEASVTNAEVGRMADGKWMMFDDALKAFKGSVENVALWSRKLSDAEVLAAFKALPRSAGMIVIVK